MALLDQAIAGKGGLEKLRAIKTIVARQTLTNAAAGGSNVSDQTNYIQYPDRFRIEMQTPNGPVINAGTCRSV